MAQYNNGHLTTAQLSAYVDRELTRDESARCAAHLQICPECQAVLADLRLTSTLLRKMPQVVVPRSFILPLNMSVLPATPAIPERETPRPLQPARSQSALKRSLRVLSTLAAVIGLIFLLVGAFTSLPQVRLTTLNRASSSVPRTAPSAATPSLAGVHASPRATEQTAANATARAHQASPVERTPTASSTRSAPQPSEQQFSLPPALDLGQPEGRLSIGAALLLLGLLGFLLTRPRRARREVGG